MAIIDQLNGSTPQGLSLQGESGPNFENESMRTDSKIQALVDGGSLVDSEDLLTGRDYGSGVTSTYAPPSQPPVSFPDDIIGNPYYPSLGGPYSQNGPMEGRY
jgi:hypothetical protein